MGVPSSLLPAAGSPRSPGALFAQKRRTVHTVRAHRKVCAEKSSLAHADLSLTFSLVLCRKCAILILYDLKKRLQQ